MHPLSATALLLLDRATSSLLPVGTALCASHHPTKKSPCTLSYIFFTIIYFFLPFFAFVLVNTAFLNSDTSLQRSLGTQYYQFCFRSFENTDYFNQNYTIFMEPEVPSFTFCLI